MPEPKEPAEVLPGPPKKRGRSSTAWVKGQPSPNPGGRPKGYADLREACRRLTDRAVQALEDALDHKDHRIRVVAAKELLDRGWGKPATTIEVGVTPESALAKLAEALIENEEEES